MKKTYMKRVWKFYRQLVSPYLADYARTWNQNTFTRKRKMPLEDILLCCLAKKGLTTVMELRNYFQKKGGKTVKISKQAYLQQRKRLNPDVFLYFNNSYLEDFYNSSEPELWNGYLVLAIDGSKTEIPNSRENRETFGTCRNQNTKEGLAHALVSGMYDVLNGFYINIQVAQNKASENELAKKNILNLGKAGITQPVLVIFDRGYPSLEFINFLERQGIHYLFRLSCNDYMKERGQMESNDSFAGLAHDAYRLGHIRKKHPESYLYMKEKGSTRVRIIKTTMPPGQEMALVTDLPEGFTTGQVTELYYKRWEIEKKYNTLENKMKFESVTGKVPVYVYQDFYAQMFVYNMLQDIKRSADREARKAGKEKNLKYPQRVNENIAIGLFKEDMVQLILEENPARKEKMFAKLQAEMEGHVLPERKLPGHVRRKNKSNKYQGNLKSSF